MQFNIQSGEYNMSNIDDPIYDYISKIMIVEKIKESLQADWLRLRQELWFEGRTQALDAKPNEIKTMRLGMAGVRIDNNINLIVLLCIIKDTARIPERLDIWRTN